MNSAADKSEPSSQARRGFLGVAAAGIAGAMLAPGVQFPALQPVKLESVLPAGRNVKKVHTASHSGLLLLE